MLTVTDIDSLVADGWMHEVAYRDGEPVADVFIKGTSIHFESRVEGKAMTRKNTLAFLKKIFDVHGYVTTKVPIDVTDHRLRKVLGFKHTHNDDNFSFWFLEELPWSKKT